MLSITAAVGFMVLFQTYFPTGQGKVVYDTLMASTTVIIAFLTIAGTFQLFRLQVPEILKRSERWSMAVVTVGSALTVFILCLVLGQGSPLVDYMFYRGFTSGFQKATTATHAWVICYAILRYLSFRNRDLASFSVGILAVIISQAPLIAAVAPPLYGVATWLRTNVAGTAGNAVNIGLAFGMVLTAARVLIGRETGFLGKMEEQK